MIAGPPQRRRATGSRARNAVRFALSVYRFDNISGPKVGYLRRYVDQPPMPHAASIKPW